MTTTSIPWWSILVAIFAAIGITLIFLWIGTPDQMPQVKPPRSRPPNPYINASYQCTFDALGVNGDYGNLNCSKVIDGHNTSESFCAYHNPWVGNSKGLDGECVIPCTAGLGLPYNPETGIPMEFYNRNDATFPVYINFTNGSTIVNFLHHYQTQNPLDPDAPEPINLTAPISSISVSKTFWNQPIGTWITDPVYYINGGELTAELIAFYINVMGNIQFIPQPLVPFGSPNGSIAQECFGNSSAVHVEPSSIFNILFRFLAWDDNTNDIIAYYCNNMPSYCLNLFVGFDDPETHDDARIAFYLRMLRTLKDYNNAFPNCINQKTLHCFVLEPFEG